MQVPMRTSFRPNQRTAGHNQRRLVMSIYNRQDRHLPVRPNLDQLKHQAKELLRDIRRGDPAAIEEFNQYHPKPVAPAEAQLADAQLALARSYQAPSWPRLVQACELID